MLRPAVVGYTLGIPRPESWRHTSLRVHKYQQCSKWCAVREAAARLLQEQRDRSGGAEGDKDKADSNLTVRVHVGEVEDSTQRKHSARRSYGHH